MKMRRRIGRCVLTVYTLYQSTTCTTRAQILREKQEEYERDIDQQFQYNTPDSISDILVETGEIHSSSDEDD